jgi:RNA polymerase sigma factor (sigma-70 family)
MTPQEFSDALDEVGRTDFLERMAKRSGAGLKAQDIAQDVRAQLVQMTPEIYADIRNLKAYAATMVRNRYLAQVVRKSAETPLEELSEDEKKEFFQKVEEQIGLANPYEKYEREQVLALARELIEGMDSFDRAIAHTTHLEGESTRAAAEKHGVTPHRARSARERVLKKLMKFFDGSAENDRGGKD